jgi:hypothetical protein
MVSATELMLIFTETKHKLYENKRRQLSNSLQIRSPRSY